MAAKVCDVSNECFGTKFGFSRLLWGIKNYCITIPLSGEIYFIPEFYVRGVHLTRWKISLQRSCIEGGRYKVFLHLRRLECPPFDEIVTADCNLIYSSHTDGEEHDIDFRRNFAINQVFAVEMAGAGITPVVYDHIPEFKLKFEIVVCFYDTLESIILCEDSGIRRLSDDLYQIYDDGINTDLDLRFSSNRTLHVHKFILLSRIKNTKFTELFHEKRILNLEDFVAEEVEKVIRFLYSGRLSFTAHPEPSVAVYKFAEWLDVKPILNYYNPDEIKFTSSTDVEEFSATWTIDAFFSREDFQSPVITNKKMDTKWQINVYPKSSRNNVDMDILLVYEILESKVICVELFLLGGPDDRISYIFHTTVENNGNFQMRKSIKLDEVKQNYIKDDTLTIGLQLRMSSGQNNLAVCDGSKAGYKYLSEQKYYDLLSDDISLLYRQEKAYDVHQYLSRHNITIKAHGVFLERRCSSLLPSLMTTDDSILNLTDSTILQVMEFVYSGKLDKRYILERMGDWYDAAVFVNYEHLKRIIQETLQNMLSPENALRIHEFALGREIQILIDPARI